MPEDQRFYILTVLYNRKIEDIRSIDVFMEFTEKHPDAALIIADNSTDEAVKAHNAASDLPLTYIDCGGNSGLSRAYNLALNTIEDREYRVMTADDDTLFEAEYVENVYAASKEESNRDRVICGVVDAGGKWISPRTTGTANAAASFLLKRPEPGVYVNRDPINSGMCISGGLIRKTGGYDERLFLDGVDYLLMYKLRQSGYGEVLVVPGKITQEFSGDSADKESVLRRWEIYRKDFKTYCEITHKSAFYKYYYLARRALGIRLKLLFKGRR